LKLLRRELGDQAALLGFSGSPWTLATFMLEGGSVPTYTRARALFATEPKVFHRLMEKLTVAVTAYLQMQIAAGVDALQLFDSHGGHLPATDFDAASGRWMKEIIARLSPAGGRPAPPVIVFSLGTHGNWQALAGLGAAVVGVDHEVSLAGVGRQLPASIGVQGNLDPSWLLATPAEVVRETRRILAEMQGRPGHIFNLGHGVPPAAKLENIAALVETVQAAKTTAN
jgi:uroporphyrinogen decarboxylase